MGGGSLGFGHNSSMINTGASRDCLKSGKNKFRLKCRFSCIVPHNKPCAKDTQIKLDLILSRCRQLPFINNWNEVKRKLFYLVDNKAWKLKMYFPEICTNTLS